MIPGGLQEHKTLEAIGDWIREDVTANTGPGKAVTVHKKIDAFLARLAERTKDVNQRCRRDLQSLADALVAKASEVAL